MRRYTAKGTVGFYLRAKYYLKYMIDTQTHQFTQLVGFLYFALANAI